MKQLQRSYNEREKRRLRAALTRPQAAEALCKRLALRFNSTNERTALRHRIMSAEFLQRIVCLFESISYHLLTRGPSLL